MPCEDGNFMIWMSDRRQSCRIDHPPAMRCGCASPARPLTGTATPPPCAWNWARGRATAPSTWPSPALRCGKDGARRAAGAPGCDGARSPSERPTTPLWTAPMPAAKAPLRGDGLGSRGLGSRYCQHTGTQAHVIVDTLSGSAIVQSVTSVVENAALTVPAGGNCPLPGGAQLARFLPPPPRGPPPSPST